MLCTVSIRSLDRLIDAEPRIIDALNSLVHLSEVHLKQLYGGFQPCEVVKSIFPYMMGKLRGCTLQYQYPLPFPDDCVPMDDGAPGLPSLAAISKLHHLECLWLENIELLQGEDTLSPACSSVKQLTLISSDVDSYVLLRAFPNVTELIVFGLNLSYTEAGEAWHKLDSLIGTLKSCHFIATLVKTHIRSLCVKSGERMAPIEDLRMLLDTVSKTAPNVLLCQLSATKSSINIYPQLVAIAPKLTYLELELIEGYDIGSCGFSWWMVC